MTGGLLNIVSFGNQNVYLNGNPSKTFFTSTYKKYTNFGLQKFRIDFNGLRTLRMTESSKFTFKIPRYAELLMDSYIVVTLPTIWSPIIPPSTVDGEWAPYEFKWIENLGTKMIEQVNINVGGQTIQSYTGNYLLSLVERDFDMTKRDLYDKMTGNTPELNDPGNSGARVNQYPNSYYTSATQGSEPSIRARKLYIPINTFFTMSSKMSFPLVSLQYNELEIEVIIRPVQELIQIRDVEDQDNMFPYIKPNFNNAYHQFHRFLQSPPDIELGTTSYHDKRTNWNADIHMISTYGFLSKEESKVFASQEQTYLIKNVYEYKYHNVTGSKRVKLENSMGMVSSYMWYFQRSDIDLRNEWSNYTNWPYKYLPYDLEAADASGEWALSSFINEAPELVDGIGPGLNPDGSMTGYYLTGLYTPDNQKDILLNLGILLDGKYRENVMESGVYNYIEKYVRTKGNAPDGLYCYNFCLNTDPFELQPTGAMNMSKFKDIQLEFTTYSPPLDPSAQTFTICDPSSGVIIGVNKPTWRIYDYNYDMTVFEERYNILNFVGGNCGLQYAR
jgi:hypothetical protein